jgi:hypothetical protein
MSRFNDPADDHTETRLVLSLAIDRAFEKRHAEWQARIAAVRRQKRHLGRNAHPHELDAILEPSARPGRPSSFLCKANRKGER